MATSSQDTRFAASVFCRFFAKPWAVRWPDHARALLPCGHETHARTPHRGRCSASPSSSAPSRPCARRSSPRERPRHASPPTQIAKQNRALDRAEAALRARASPQAAGPRRNDRPPPLRPSSTTVRPRRSSTSCTATAASTRRRAATAARASMTSQARPPLRARRRRARLLRRLGGNCGASVGCEAGAGPADRRTRGAPAPAPGRLRPRQRHRDARWTTYRRQLAAQHATARAASPQTRPSVRVVNSASARRHEVVMKSRSVPRDGHDRGARARRATTGERALDAAESEFERLEQIMSRFRPTSELSCLNRDEFDRGLSRARRCRRPRPRRARADRRSLRSDGARCTRRSRLRQNVRGAAARRPQRPAATCGGGVELVGRRITLADGVRLDLGGIGKGYAAERVAELLALAGPCLVSAGGDVAVRGLPAAGTWAGRGRREPHPRPRARRLGDLRHRPAALAVRRRRAASSDRPVDGPTRSRRPHPCDRHRQRCRRRRSAREDALARRRGGSRMRRARRADDERRADRHHRRALMHHDPTFWLLARAAGSPPTPC